MDQDMEAPPMGGENIPFKELKIQPKVDGSTVKPKAKGKLLILFIVLIIALAVIFGIFIGLMFKPKSKTAVLPSPLANLPSPSVKALPSVAPQDIKGKIDNFEKNLNEVDLEEQSLSFPRLDFKIRFELLK